MSDNEAVLNGYTQEVEAEKIIASSNTNRYFLLTRPDTDFSGTFRAWDMDAQEFIIFVPSGWNIIKKQDHASDKNNILIRYNLTSDYLNNQTDENWQKLVKCVLKEQKAQKLYPKKIYEVLTKQSFWDWYTDDGRFEKYIRGDEYCPIKEEILKDISEMFGLE